MHKIKLAIFTRVVYYVTHPTACYPIPETIIQLEEISEVSYLGKMKHFDSDQQQMMREWPFQQGKCVRQCPSRQEITKSQVDAKLEHSSWNTSGVLDLGLSDHNLIYTVMRLQCPKFSPRTVVKRHFKHYDPGLFLADIATVPFHVAHIFDDPGRTCSNQEMLF